jgi:hypothetical protein
MSSKLAADLFDFVKAVERLDTPQAVLDGLDAINTTAGDGGAILFGTSAFGANVGPAIVSVR